VDRGGAVAALYVPFAAATARLDLEILTPAHAPLLIDGLADPALYTWLDQDPPDLSGLTRRFEFICGRPAPDGQLWLNWALRKKSDHGYAGLAEATVYPNRKANLAYFVFVADQGNGYAVEACNAVIAHLARDYGADPVLIDVDTRNVASQRVAEKLGFERAREPKLAGTLRGEPQWDFCYSLRLQR
jgi:[ribosomal protein S5]-alanine N-acetyltransferase